MIAISYTEPNSSCIKINVCRIMQSRFGPSINTVDGSHIIIQASHQNEEVYVNRKGEHILIFEYPVCNRPYISLLRKGG